MEWESNGSGVNDVPVARQSRDPACPAGHLPKDNNLASSTVTIVTLDTAIAIISGLAILPAVFSFGFEPTEGFGQLPTGSKVKFLDDGATYLGNQLESTLESGRCFGIAANADFILVCTYEENGENPELIVYKKR